MVNYTMRNYSLKGATTLICVYKILIMERHIAAHLSTARRASPVELHKLLDDFLTWTQSGECTIYLSLRLQCTMFQITPTMIAVPTTYNSDLPHPPRAAMKSSFSNFRVHFCIGFSRGGIWLVLQDEYFILLKRRCPLFETDPFVNWLQASAFWW